MEASFLIQPSTFDISLPFPLAPTIQKEAIRHDSRWGLTAAMATVGGASRATGNTTVAAWADIFPDRRGIEKIEFDSSFAVQGAGGKWSPGRGRCLGCVGDRWETLWETPPMDNLFQPLPIVGDFDSDGELEVAILPWKELVILNARTGAVETRCQFTEGRSYGSFGAYDLDSDGISEFVVQADFAKHIDVLGYRGDRIELLWQRNIELDISNPQTILRAHPTPVGRFTREGPLSVLASLFDSDGDRRWHLVVHNGLDGGVLADLVDRYLQGIVDLDGDGLEEILTTRTQRSGIPEYGPVEIVSLEQGHPRTRWENEGAGWQTWEPPTPSWLNTAATFGRRQALVRSPEGRTLAVFRKRTESQETQLVVSAWNGSDFASLLSVRGAGLSGLSVDAGGTLLVASNQPPGATSVIRASRGNIRLLDAREARVNPATAAAVERGDGNSVTLAVQSGEFLLLYASGESGHPPGFTRCISGRGQSTQWPQTRGPVFADLLGDARRQLLYSVSAPNGCARMVAQDLDGKDLWQHDFSDIPGSLPEWNSGGLILWQTGHFTSTASQDVLVTVRRSMMHSEETLLLSGKDGTELWRRNRQISQRGVGGTSFAIADFDRDGLDDCASMHPSLLYILRGNDGADLLAMDATWAGIEAKPVYFASPVVTGICGIGQPRLFFQTSQRVITAMAHADGTLAWSDGAGVSPDRTEPAIGDFDGDGQTEILSVGFTDGTRCYEAATGKIKWSLPYGANQTVSGSLSADIDSDDRDEAVIVVGSRLVCLSVGPNGSGGTIDWELQFPCDLGPPSYADLGGPDGATLLLAGSNGRLYGIR